MGLWTKKDDKTNDGTQTKSEADLLVERLGATIDEKLKPIREEFGALKTDWDSIKAEATRGADDEAARARKAADDNLTPEEKLQNENKRLLMVSLLTNARITESEVVDEVKAQWPGLVPRIKEVLASIPMDDKVKADYAQRCRNAVKLVIGDEAIKGGLRQNSDTKKFFLIDDAAGSTGGDDSPLGDPDLTWIDPRNPNRAPMTAAEQLKKLHIDPKEFAEFVKKQGGLV
jgi:hypothetical protein